MISSLKVRRKEPCAFSCGSPMASSTWDGSRDPEVHAEPLDCTDAFHIQHDQKGLSLDEFKADVAVVRQTFYRIAVQTAVRNLG